MNKPKYPLEIFLRGATVELETMKVENGLPGLDVQSFISQNVELAFLILSMIGTNSLKSLRHERFSMK
jgi:hypothetical protein